MASNWRFVACTLLAALPWLEPFAPGPSPSVLPWLVSAGCALALWSLAGWRSPGRGLLGALAALVLWAVLWHLPLRPEAAFLAAGLAVLALAAGAGRGGVDAAASAVQAGWLAAAAASAVIGLCQYFGVAPRFAPWMNPGAAGEAFGNLRQTNQFATLCSLGTAVVLWGRLQLPRPAAAALMVLLAAASAASASRTGLVEGMAVAGLAIAWGGRQRRERIVLCLWAAAAYLAAMLLLPLALEAMAGMVPERTVWRRFSGGAGCASRRVLWDNVLHLIALKPVAGWGWGELDYAHFMTLYPGERFCDILDNAHNLPLHLAVELGVPAALAVCGGVLLWALRRRPWQETEPLRQLAWAVLALVALHSLLEYPLWYGPFQLAAGLALGWLLATGADAAPHPEPAARAGPIAAGVLAAATLYAGWDYLRVSQIYIEPEQRLAPWRDDTVRHVRRSWLFGGQAGFAELTLATLTPRNADWMRERAEAMLHYSPEPRVIERAIESSTMQERYDEAVLHLARYRAAFPREYAKWREANRRPLPLAR